MPTSSTTTVDNQTPEQKALAQAQLAQLQKRLAFEDFAGQILLGGVPGLPAGIPTGGTTQTIKTGGGSTPPAPQPAGSTIGGGGGSNLQNTMNNAASGASSLGNLIMPNAPLPRVQPSPSVDAPRPVTGGSSILSGIGSKLADILTEPKTIGTAIGALSGIPGGALAGSAIGSLFTPKAPTVPQGAAPSPEVKASSQSLPPPMKVTSVTAPYDRSPGGPTGAQTAARAQQTALQGMYHTAQAYEMMGGAAAHDMDAGASAGQGGGNAVGGMMSSLASAEASRIVAEMRAAGKDLKDPVVSAEITRRVNEYLSSYRTKHGI